MGSPTIIVKQQWTTADVLRSHEHPGRPTNGRLTPGGWIADLTGLKKVIILCSFCRPKWNPRKHGYRKMYIPDPSGKTDGYQSNGTCDGCKQRTENCGGGTAFIHESTYHQVCEDPLEARRLARRRWKIVTGWQAERRRGRWARTAA